MILRWLPWIFLACLLPSSVQVHGSALPESSKPTTNHQKIIKEIDDGTLTKRKLIKLCSTKDITVMDGLAGGAFSWSNFVLCIPRILLSTVFAYYSIGYLLVPSWGAGYTQFFIKNLSGLGWSVFRTFFWYYIPERRLKKEKFFGRLYAFFFPVEAKHKCLNFMLILGYIGLHMLWQTREASYLLRVINSSKLTPERKKELADYLLLFMEENHIDPLQPGMIIDQGNAGYASLLSSLELDPLKAEMKKTDSNAYYAQLVLYYAYRIVFYHYLIETIRLTMKRGTAFYFAKKERLDVVANNIAAYNARYIAYCKANKTPLGFFRKMTPQQKMAVSVFPYGKVIILSLLLLVGGYLMNPHCVQRSQRYSTKESLYGALSVSVTYLSCLMLLFATKELAFGAGSLLLAIATLQWQLSLALILLYNAILIGARACLVYGAEWKCLFDLQACREILYFWQWPLWQDPIWNPRYLEKFCVHTKMGFLGLDLSQRVQWLGSFGSYATSKPGYILQDSAPTGMLPYKEFAERFHSLQISWQHAKNKEKKQALEQERKALFDKIYPVEIAREVFFGTIPDPLYTYCSSAEKNSESSQ